jgi:hypothetical protein
MTFTAKTKNNQAGVSLMLAVLVLAAITAVAFSLASIVFIEIRSSGDALRTEPTLYGSFGVTEEALFQYKRFYTGSNFDVTNCPASQSSDVNNICHFNGVTLTLPGTQPIAFDNSPGVVLVPANSTKTTALFVANSFAQQFDSIQIEVLPNSGSAGVDASFVITTDTSSTSTTPVTVNPGTVYPYTSFGSGQYELVLTNSSSHDVSVSLTTHRVGGALPGGLPYVGEQVLRIQADFQGLNRTYQVRIPIP